MSLPSIITLPSLGFKTPAIALKRVVFPAPLGPISPVMDPFFILKDAPSTAQNPPKYFFTFFTSIILKCPNIKTARI